MGEVTRFALLAALDEDPDNLAEEFCRADRRRHLSPLSSELSVSHEHPNNFRLIERGLVYGPLDGFRLYLLALVKELLYPSDHV
ncbi:MAG TPA: hypothetical protein VHS97_22850 [Isosphaeraceae bacterium]|nr:hypothetical protein [Isosphaeraceae bacterium]